MAVPARSPQGVKTVTVVNANLFTLAEQYLGDATQWDRIALLNSIPGVAPDFLVAGPVTIQIPDKAARTARSTPEPSVEQILFGVQP
jgi:nucleoid-associated protein YgaU